MSAPNLRIHSDFLARLAVIEENFDEFESDDEAQERDNEEEHKIFVGFLSNTCALVREAEAAGASNLPIVIDQADQFINRAVCFAYGDPGVCDFMPSFAHSQDAHAPLIEDKRPTDVFSHGFLSRVQPILAMLLDMQGGSFPGGRMPKTAEPWANTMKPHPKTSRLARFKEDIPTLSATSSLSNTIYQARAEVTSSCISTPIQLSLSTGGSCLALVGAGGYKNRTPQLSFYLLDEETDQNFPEEYEVSVGLSGIAYHSATDEIRKLIFVADNDRIKSYAWGAADDDQDVDGCPTHTLKSNGFNGPLAVLANGTVIRAGKGSAASWTIDELPTHGPSGTKRIGKKYSIEDSWRDDAEDIELSSGSKPSGKIAFDDKNYTPARWHPHPASLAASSGSMLCVSDPKDTLSYSCVVLDLEHGGKISGKYLGHGGTVDAFSTSPIGDPTAFLTACSDGIVRLYDTRHPLPTMSFNVGNGSGGCCAALLVHPDGIPTVFTGAEQGEHIKLWDVRAATSVYELSTGNNAVNAMAWDAQRNDLYAATECNYVDRLGYHHEYRRAKAPKAPKPQDESDENHNSVESRDDDRDADDNEYSEGDDDEDDYDDEDAQCWPKNAYHDESYFGYFFDAGEHRIYRYAFKEDANITVVPPYGQATLETGEFW